MIRRSLSIFLAALLLPAASFAKDRPKIGLVLSGGGARGFAHIGVLHILDSLQIPVDYIVGTSIGSIGGGLYAVGYSAAEIEAITRSIDWDDMFTDAPARELRSYQEKKFDGRYQASFTLKGFTPAPPSGAIAGQKISLLFSRLTAPYTRALSFDSLPTPFRAIAVDLGTANEVVLSSGSLAAAMRASMSIPSVFVPVPWGDSLLIDGGALNNFPVNVARSIGADFVIGVDVGTPLRRLEELGDLFTILEQTVNVMSHKRDLENVKQTDIYIKPELNEFSSSDFSRESFDEMVRRGLAAARRALPQFDSLKHALQKYEPQKEDTMTARIVGISVFGNSLIPREQILSTLSTAPGDPVDVDELNKHVGEMRKSGLFSSVRYRLIPIDSVSFHLRIRVTENVNKTIGLVTIEGLKTLSEDFVLPLLDVFSGQPFDIDALEIRINRLYALGYFNRILYQVERIDHGKIGLHFIAEERPNNRLRAGFRYDNYHQLVAALGLQTMNIPFSGIRIESEVQFPGLFRFISEISYPSRSLDLPVFPYVAVRMRDLPVDIYDDKGKLGSRYSDRSNAVVFGFTWLTGTHLMTQIDYGLEYVRVMPIVFGSAISADYREFLRPITATISMDRLDNVLLPRKGYAFHSTTEWNEPALGSPVRFFRTQARFDGYVSPSEKSTYRFHAGLWFGDINTPLYKSYAIGGPWDFVGFAYTQAIARGFLMARMEYRYAYKKDIFAKAIVNVAPLYGLADPLGTKRGSILAGYGAGLEFHSIIGPLQVIIAQGDNNLYKPGNKHTVLYVTAGTFF